MLRRNILHSSDIPSALMLQVETPIFRCPLNRFSFHHDLSVPVPRPYCPTALKRITFNLFISTKAMALFNLFFKKVLKKKPQEGEESDDPCAYYQRVTEMHQKRRAMKEEIIKCEMEITRIREENLAKEKAKELIKLKDRYEQYCRAMRRVLSE